MSEELSESSDESSESSEELFGGSSSNTMQHEYGDGIQLSRAGHHGLPVRCIGRV